MREAGWTTQTQFEKFDAMKCVRKMKSRWVCPVAGYGLRDERFCAATPKRQRDANGDRDAQTS